MPLFEVAVIKTGKKDNNGNIIDGESILVVPYAVVAKDMNQANTICIIENSGLLSTEDKDRIQVIARPFA